MKTKNLSASLKKYLKKSPRLILNEEKQHLSNGRILVSDDYLAENDPAVNLDLFFTIQGINLWYKRDIETGVNTQAVIPDITENREFFRTNLSITISDSKPLLADIWSTLESEYIAIDRDISMMAPEALYSNMSTLPTVLRSGPEEPLFAATPVRIKREALSPFPSLLSDSFLHMVE